MTSAKPAIVPSEKRVWKPIDEQVRLKLQNIVNDLGIPAGPAGKIIKIDTRNANRIVSRYQQTKQLEM